jgi:hypothetical protein
MAWKADRAILSHLHRDAPEAAGVCWHMMIEYPVINSHHRSADGGRLGEIQPARLTVGVVGEIDDYGGWLRVHFDGNLHRDAVRNAMEWVVRRVDHAPAGLEPPDGFHHLGLRVVEPGFRIALERVPADLLASASNSRSAMRTAPSEAR